MIKNPEKDMIIYFSKDKELSTYYKSRYIYP